MDKLEDDFLAGEYTPFEENQRPSSLPSPKITCYDASE